MNTMTDARTWRIFLTDDHLLLREGLRTLISGEPDIVVVGESSDGEGALQQIESLSPDIVVMDLSLPGASGMVTTARIRKQWPKVAVLILTMHDDRNYLRQCLEAGASGYILKRSAAAELLRAIRTLGNGGFYVDSSFGGAMSELLRRPPLRGEMVGAALSERETEVLKSVAQGYANKEIAAQLKLSIKTVETYKARSMEKLNLGGRAEIVRYALEQGWLRQHGCGDD